MVDVNTCARVPCLTFPLTWDLRLSGLRGEFELQNSKQQGASRVSMKKKSVVSPRSFADLKTNEKTLRDLEEGDNDPASLDPSESTLVPPEPVVSRPNLPQAVFSFDNSQ